MNIYEKIQSARCIIQQGEMKKSGKNKFAGYEYFELADMLPVINKTLHELKLFSMVEFTAEMATLTIIDAEKPVDQVCFTSPMSSANLKGCHDVQNLGAVQTYLRRYLYTNALEIVEHDALEPTVGQPASKKPAQKPPEKPAGIDTDLLARLIVEKGKEMKAVLQYYKVDTLEDLSDAEKDKLYKMLTK